MRIICAISIGYILLGITLDEFNIISHPAYWSLYGAVFGSLITYISLRGRI